MYDLLISTTKSFPEEKKQIAKRHIQLHKPEHKRVAHVQSWQGPSGSTTQVQHDFLHWTKLSHIFSLHVPRSPARKPLLVRVCYCSELAGDKTQPIPHVAPSAKQWRFDKKRSSSLEGVDLKLPPGAETRGRSWDLTLNTAPALRSSAERVQSSWLPLQLMDSQIPNIWGRKGDFEELLQTLGLGQWANNKQQQKLLRCLTVKLSAWCLCQ